MKGKHFIMATLISLVLVSSLMIALAQPVSSIITINIVPTTVTVGSNVTISGTITPVRVNVDVSIYYRLTGGTWALLATVKTDSSSNYVFTWKTTEAGIYELKSLWIGDAVTLPAESAIVTVEVVGEGNVSTYDPWCDINDDGQIDIEDVANVAIRYGTFGTPINKTALLLEIQSKIEDLENTLMQNRTKIRIVIWTNASRERLSFNGMSITDAYTYNITYGRTVLRYDGGLNIMMNQIQLETATWAYPYLNIEIPLRVLISNKTISIEAYNGGGVENAITIITFYNANGTLVASFTNRQAPAPYETETFYIDSNGFFL